MDMAALKTPDKMKGPLFLKAESSFPCARLALPSEELAGETVDVSGVFFPLPLLVWPKIKIIITTIMRSPPSKKKIKIKPVQLSMKEKAVPINTSRNIRSNYN